MTHPDSIRRYLEGTGLSPANPDIAPARALPQDELDADVDDFWFAGNPHGGWIAAS